MSVETALNGAHTAHMVERYVGSAYEHVKRVSEHLCEVKAAGRATMEGTIYRGRVTEPAELSCDEPINMGTTGAQGPAGEQGPKGDAGNAVVDANVLLIADSTGSTMAHGNPNTINWGHTRALNKSLDSVTTDAFSWAIGRTFTAINGIFNVKATVDFGNVVGDVTGLELRCTVTNNTNTTILRDYAIVENGTISKATLHLDFMVMGNFDNGAGELETANFEIIKVGDETTTSVDVIGGSSRIEIVRIAAAPTVYTPAHSN